MKKIVLLWGLLMAAYSTGMAQSLEKMQWFNEPEQWEIKDNKVLTMSVTPQSDYWRISHYGFTVDDAPFYYATYGGEFEVKVKVTGEYKERFDQAGLMLRIDHENYIKTGIEFVDGKYNLSTVVTHKTSDWSVINHAPVRSLMRHHRTQIVFAVYKLDSGLDVVFMVNAQHQTCLVKALLIFSGNLDFHLKLASVSGIIKRCVVYGKSVM